MLIKSSLSSVETGLCRASDDGKVVLCDRVPSGQTWKVYLKRNKYHLDWSTKSQLMEENERNADDPYSSNCLSSSGGPSPVSIMTENTAPQMVYRRKKLRNSTTSPLKLGLTNVQTSGNCPSVISSFVHLPSADQPVGFQAKHENEMIKDSTMPSVLCDGVAKEKMQNILVIASVNDSCSSSKSNMELVLDSIDTEMDETGECSSSSVIVMDVTREDVTEKDFCINILRIHGLLGGDSLADSVASMEDAVTTGNSYCSRSCKTCGHLDHSLNMLLCDHCEDAYHPACYNSRLKKLLVDEWFCHSCLKKRQKILKETIIRSPGIHSEMGKCRSASVNPELNHILLMLRDTKSYTTSVRVGKGFQVQVIDWSGPIRSDDDELLEPFEVNPSEFDRLQEGNLRNPTRLSSISNWLQCREVTDRTKGTICGKWRRAPLFEVQTEDWECFCAIHWDPSHADCAVPQELETDQVMKQLKYIETLRQRKTDLQPTVVIKKAII
ncbi:PREDICTED: uncharacterized protein LOC109326548 isoform X2 [Lupinus angustifolius]|nr:PREDICTED: uncharacterized protein LOC109326548 isoform X2 [Lupinus angustifolius]